MAADEHSPQAIILIPRNKLHHLLGSDADIGAIMALVVDDQKNHPSGVSVRVDMLELMTRILDSCKDKLGWIRNPGRCLESQGHVTVPQRYSTLHRRRLYSERASEAACHACGRIASPTSGGLERMVRQPPFSCVFSPFPLCVIC